jgi:hypothetical protein
MHRYVVDATYVKLNESHQPVVVLPIFEGCQKSTFAMVRLLRSFSVEKTPRKPLTVQRETQKHGGRNCERKFFSCCVVSNSHATTCLVIAQFASGM